MRKTEVGTDRSRFQLAAGVRRQREPAIERPPVDVGIVQRAARPAIAIRRARPQDKGPVEDITRTVWGGSDHLPRMYDEWVRDRRGGLFVAVAHDEVVGVAKLTMVGAAEAWLEGLRVAPRRRGQGIGQLLVRHRMDRARDLGMLVVRLATARENFAARRVALRTGMRRVAVIVAWTASARPGGTADRARRADMAELWRLLSGRTSRAGPRLTKVPGKWVWRAFRQPDLARDVAAGRCVVTRRDGRATGAAIVYPEGEALIVPVIGGTVAGCRRLLAVLPSEAEARGAHTVRVLTSPRHLAGPLQSMGFSRGSAQGWIYEHRFDARARTQA